MAMRDPSGELISKPAIYLAGPVAYDVDAGQHWRERVAVEFADLVEPVNPLDKYDAHADDVTITGPGRSEPDDDAEAVSATALVEADLDLLAGADGVLVGWREDIPSTGTPMEVALAHSGARFRPNVGPVPVAVWRSAADSWFDDPISPWLEYHADYLTGDLDAAVGFLVGAAGTERGGRDD